MQNKSSLAQKVAAHELHIIYQVDGIVPDAGPQIQLGALLEGPDSEDSAHIPADQKDALQGRYRETQVWVKAESAGSRPSMDLHPYVRQILSGERRDLAECWTLSPQAQRFLSSADLYEKSVVAADRNKKQLLLKFTPSAVSRMQALDVDSESVRISIESIKLFSFITGHSIVDVQVSVDRPDKAPLTAIELTELTASVSRFNKTGWAAQGEQPQEFFPLGRLIRQLVAGSDVQSEAWYRARTYIYARFDEPVDDQTQEYLAQLLARHYTTDYQVAAEVEGVQTLRPFANVLHTLALEGAATLIAPSPEHPQLATFLDSFRENVFRAAYLPVLILAAHEHAFLLHRTTASTLSMNKKTEETYSELRQLRESALVFRLCFRFSQVSQISMHNSFHRACRNAFGSDEMLTELANDVEASDAYISEALASAQGAIEHDRHRRFYWATVTGGAGLSGLTTYTICKEVVTLMVKDQIVGCHISPGWTAVALGLGVAFVAAVVGVLKRPPKQDHSHDGHLSTHAMIEHMIKGTLK